MDLLVTLFHVPIFISIAILFNISFSIKKLKKTFQQRLLTVMYISEAAPGMNSTKGVIFLQLKARTDIGLVCLLLFES